MSLFKRDYIDLQVQRAKFQADLKSQVFTAKSEVSTLKIATQVSWVESRLNLIE